MCDSNVADNLVSAVRSALMTTGGTTVCPFHCDVTIRVGDDAAESHAIVRAKKNLKAEGTTWDREDLMEEFRRQLIEAADGVCPQCVNWRTLHSWQASACAAR